MSKNLADCFISSGYKQHISDNNWEVIEEKWDGTFLEVFIEKEGTGAR
jgi:hypothetical protein